MTRDLTPRELEAMKAYARLGSLKEAAVVMGVRYHTIRTHMARIYVKLDAGTAFEALTRLGWLVVPEDEPA